MFVHCWQSVANLQQQITTNREVGTALRTYHCKRATHFPRLHKTSQAITIQYDKPEIAVDMHMMSRRNVTFYPDSRAGK